MLKIAVGSDHGGLDYKNEIAKYLKSKGYEVCDVGTNSYDSCHYPVFGFAAANLVASGRCDYGVVVCTSGEGISIAANKIKGIRCGVGYNDDVAKLMRQHNDCNMIAFGQKFMDLSDVLRRVDIFLSTSFEGGRHAIRVNMIKEIEK
ncbi:MAG: ribose 5-phosphate isomerase B [Bacilli bacterium]